MSGLRAAAAVMQRAAHVDLTVHLADGQTITMGVDAAAVTVDRREGYDYADVYSFQSPIRAIYASPAEVTVTVEGVLGAGQIIRSTPAAPPVPAVKWDSAASDPISDVRAWAQKTRDEPARPAEPAPGVDDLPDLAGLPAFADITG